jgi:hypothetical protein
MANLQFKNKRTINSKNYKDLTQIHLQQMAISATLGFGSDYTTPEHFMEQTGDGHIDDAIIELWDIVDKENPDESIYDCWYYLYDTANVFFAGTTKDTNAAMCQDFFEDMSGDGSCEELCQDLQKAYFDKENVE